MASRPGWAPGYWGYDAGSDDLMAWGPEQTTQGARSVPWTDGPDSSELDIKVFRIDYSEGHHLPRGGPFTGETGDDHPRAFETCISAWPRGPRCVDPNTEPA